MTEWKVGDTAYTDYWHGTSHARITGPGMVQVSIRHVVPTPWSQSGVSYVVKGPQATVQLDAGWLHEGPPKSEDKP